MAKTAFAVACHPDDIEFLMAGTLIMLKEAGYEIHYMNVANGSCGTASYNREDIIRLRREEGMAAAKLIGAHFHESIVDDLDVYYDRKPGLKLASTMREVAPEIVLLQSPSDYMEDHQNTVRLAVTAAFCRGMRNYAVDPPHPPVEQDVTLYHAPPHGNRDALRRLVKSGLYVDVGSVIDKKTDMLACHKTQKEWLDVSQGMDSYLVSMQELSKEVGKLSGKYEYAEGWRRHSHLGFCGPDTDPLYDALKDYAIIDEEYEKSLG
ncbi:MAG: PIG-L deacetylase family protein [Planctomycetota bacterium]|jgi:LmbE family N-acetylglucosaminyl deacetylase